ncbi:hypothetical protein KAH55_12290 [bacterium]|nr:hypothetical protein [bacterium]
MFQKLTQRWQALDRYTRRGIVFGVLALTGIFLELVIVAQSRQFILFGYGFILVVALSCIFWFKDASE